MVKADGVVWRTSFLVLLRLASLRVRCGAAAGCPEQPIGAQSGGATHEGPLDWPTYRWLTHEEATDCLQRLTISVQNVYHTVTHLEHGISKLYSFTHIAKDSTKSRHSLSQGCSFPVHDVKVDLQGELEAVKGEVLQELREKGAEGISSFEDLLQRKDEIGAYSFHHRLESIFRSLRDAHTVYVGPIRAHLMPFHSYAEAVAEGGGAGGGAPIGMRLRPAAGRPGVLEASHRSEFREVEEVVGSSLKPWDWLLDLVDSSVGNYKSRGARVNSLLARWEEMAIVTGAIPKDGTLVLKLKGLEEPVKYEVMVYALNLQLDDYQRLISENPKWDAIQSWLQEYLNLPVEPKPKESDDSLLGWLGAQGGRGEPAWLREAAEGVALGPRRPGSSSPPPPRGESSRRLSSAASAGASEVHRFPKGSKRPVAAVYRLQSSKAVVLKISTFMLEGEEDEAGEKPSTWTLFEDFFKFYKDVEREAVRTKKRRLILDLAGNGGGMVEFGNLLVALLAPGLDTKQKLCPVYTSAMDDFWKKWLESYGGKWDELRREAGRSLTASGLKERFKRLLDLKKLVNTTGPIPLNMPALEALMERVEGVESEAQQRELLVQALSPSQRDRYFYSKGRLSGLVGEDSSEGWFPFTGDVQSPATGRPFWPPLKPFKRLVTHQWGPEEAEYSQRFEMACSLASPKLWEKSFGFKRTGFHWKELAIVTDGLCGSACAAVATKLHFAAGATVFTYGGVPGEPMDHSAFAGGNVEDYADFWPQVFYAAIIGDALYGPKTWIGDALRAEGAKERHFAKTLLLPLPTRASATFNFNMMFVTEMGRKALPREWYVLPAHKHYDAWYCALPGDPRTWSRLAPLWAQVATENWAELRDALKEPGGGGGGGAVGGLAYGCAAADASALGLPKGHFVTGLLFLLFIAVAACACCFCCCRRLTRKKTQRRASPGMEMTAAPGRA